MGQLYTLQFYSHVGVLYSLAGWYSDCCDWISFNTTLFLLHSLANSFYVTFCVPDPGKLAPVFFPYTVGNEARLCLLCDLLSQSLQFWSLSLKTPVVSNSGGAWFSAVLPKHDLSCPWHIDRCLVFAVHMSCSVIYTTTAFDSQLFLTAFPWPVAGCCSSLAVPLQPILLFKYPKKNSTSEWSVRFLSIIAVSLGALHFLVLFQVHIHWLFSPFSVYLGVEIQVLSMFFTESMTKLSSYLTSCLW